MLLWLGIIFSSLAGAKTNASILAEVGKETITQAQFQNMVTEAAKVGPVDKAKFLDEIIHRSMGIQAAKASNLQNRPEVADQINTLLYQIWIEQELGKAFADIRITDEQVKQHYDRNPEVRTSSILVSVRPGADKKEWQAAQEKMKTILENHLGKEKMPFADAAQKFSDAPSAAQGGDLGFLGPDQLEPIYYQTARKLSDGQISPMIKTLIGYQVIQLQGTHKWEDANQFRAKRIVFEAEKARLFEKHMKALRGKFKVKIHQKVDA
jgi:parvulin-like peptidyl-prolyl isomerase